MNLNEFPSSPSEGDTYLIGNVTYKYTQGVWAVVSQVKTNFRLIMERLCREAGLNMVSGSFDEGATVADVNDVIWDEASAKVFSWRGTLPKTVAAGFDPTTNISSIAWIDRSNDSLRSSLENNEVTLGSSFTSTADATITGFILLKDADGIMRKLAIID